MMWQCCCCLRLFMMEFTVLSCVFVCRFTALGLFVFCSVVSEDDAVCCLCPLTCRLTMFKHWQTATHPCTTHIFMSCSEHKLGESELRLWTRARGDILCPVCPGQFTPPSDIFSRTHGTFCSFLFFPSFFSPSLFFHFPWQSLAQHCPLIPHHHSFPPIRPFDTLIVPRQTF